MSGRCCVCMEPIETPAKYCEWCGRPTYSLYMSAPRRRRSPVVVGGHQVAGEWVLPETNRGGAIVGMVKRIDTPARWCLLAGSVISVLCGLFVWPLCWPLCGGFGAFVAWLLHEMWEVERGLEAWQP